MWIHVRVNKFGRDTYIYIEIEYNLTRNVFGDVFGN